MSIAIDQLSRWRELKAQFDADKNLTADYALVRAKRQVVRPQIAQLLESFLMNETTMDELRAAWDRKTRTVWDSFGLKGLSSAMFLNILVKHLPDPKRTAEELKRIISVPDDEAEARQRMDAFESFLEAEIGAGHVARRLLQTARIPFFVSAFWHMQNPELWPMFYVSARNAFHRHGLYKAEKNIVEDYFSFRDAYRGLMSGLNSSSWDIEQLCWIDASKNKPVLPPLPPDPLKEKLEEDASIGNEVDTPLSHTHAQWLLASIGKALNFKVWIAANDHKKRWNGQRLGEMSISSLPQLGIGNEPAEKIVRLIDVLWMKGANQVVAAFEIEHSTSIYSGLLRMADLTVLSPNISFAIYIVSPEDRLEKVRRQLCRPSLQALRLHETCGFFSIEALNANADHIKKWAKEADAIEQLAEYVNETDADEIEPS